MSEFKKWYHASFEDSESWSGGFATREEVIAAGMRDYDDFFYICLASNPPVALKDWIVNPLDAAEDALHDSERVMPDFDDDTIFSVTPAQDSDLLERIRKACDEWQEAHNLVFTVRTFESMDEVERIEIPPGSEE